MWISKLDLYHVMARIGSELNLIRSDIMTEISDLQDAVAGIQSEVAAVKQTLTDFATLVASLRSDTDTTALRQQVGAVAAQAKSILSDLTAAEDAAAAVVAPPAPAPAPEPAPAPAPDAATADAAPADAPQTATEDTPSPDAPSA